MIGDIDERIARLNETNTSEPDWADIRGRARLRDRPRRVRRVLMLSIVAAFALVPAAVALRGVIGIDFGTAERAPESVERTFRMFNRGWPNRMLRVGVIPAQTRRVADVAESGNRRILWVAPTRRGGFCWLLELHPTSQTGKPAGSGGCGTKSGGRMHAGLDLIDGTRAVSGRVRDRTITRIEVAYADETVEETPIYWVSEPIGVGFFVKPLATERHGTKRATEVTARNEDGEIVKVEKLG